MGVPAFFRWLSRKYPSVIAACIEEKTRDFDGNPVTIDWSEPNPNGVEFDNLYLDMNGIIHPCTHPEDKPAPKNEDEMMIAIFECIDRLVSIVRPRKLLYMAIDGVAPRAKMNQQRSRRFRASKESVEKANDIARTRAELLLKGAHLPPEKLEGEHFDSNCITPGTPFMARLSECLKYYIYHRLNSHPGWQSIKVILSDANVPGEGEHKIMNFIRKQRAQPNHDPNTKHCLCGADADLIMLGLATHEPNFTIIREEFKPNKPKPCDLCGQLGHELKDCLGLERSNAEEECKVYGSETEYIFVRLNVLREYLERELAMPNLPFPYEFDRVLDDWVFMCFFVGNDFLPHLPSLEIREGAIDRLVTLYKDAVYKTRGYLTENGDVNLERVQLIMTELGKAEDMIFKTRQQKEIQFKARENAKRRRTEEFDRRSRPDWSVLKNTQYEPTPLGQSKTILNPRQEAYQIRKAGMHSQTEAQLQIIDSRRSLESMLKQQSDNQTKGIKRKSAESNDEEDEEVCDEVRLWEDGFKDRYYESKFDVGPGNLEFRNSVALHYVRGLCWVLRYYYQGCASWKWYFPYHYAPFASDFINISGLSTEFEAGTKPFEPLQQLMGVFPAASSKHIPTPWAKLMSDPDSPIIDFYPEDFKIDLNGKKFAWQGVALLPFVDEKRLFKALKPYYKDLTPEEVKRNVLGDDVLFVSVKTKGYGIVQGLYKEKINSEMENPILFDGMAGTILMSDECIPLNGMFNAPVRGLKPIYGNKVYSVKFRDPKYPEGFVFLAKKLKGAKLPPRVLKPQDLDEESHLNWRPQIGMAPSTTRATLAASGHRMINHHTSPQTVPKPFGSSYGGSNYSNNMYSGSNYSNVHGNYQRGNHFNYQQRSMSNQSSSYSFRQYDSTNPNASAQNNNYRGYSQQNSSEYRNNRRGGGPYRSRYVPYHSNRPQGR